MDYYIGTFSGGYVLSHHGILGQKWGKRNGPPYPLDYESRSNAEKSKNPKKSISSGDQDQSDRHASKSKASITANSVTHPDRSYAKSARISKKQLKKYEKEWQKQDGKDASIQKNLINRTVKKVSIG